MAFSTLTHLFVLLLTVALSGIAVRVSLCLSRAAPGTPLSPVMCTRLVALCLLAAFTMQVPKNVLVQFPAAWVPFKGLAVKKAEFNGYETLVGHSKP